MNFDFAHPESPGNDVVVSVIIPTFNHERFIAQALDSVLAQQTTFPIEILVGNDASTDGTGQVIDAIATQHPGRIRAFHAPHNEGGHVNFARLFTTARGKYVAWLEGDDYWTDPAKLQLQVEFLEQHPGCVLCFHQVEIRSDDATAPGALTNQNDPPISGLDRITRFNYVHTASSMFRNGIIRELPRWLFYLPLGDWPLFIMLAEHGSLGLIRRPMAVYRLQGSSVWSSRTQVSRLKSTVHVAEVLRKHLRHSGLHDCIFKTSRTITVLSLKSGHVLDAIIYAGKCLKAACSRPAIVRELWRKWRRGRRTADR